MTTRYPYFQSMIRRITPTLLLCAPLPAQLFPLDAAPGAASSNPLELIAAEDMIYFTTRGSATGPAQLHRWDGAQLSRVPINGAGTSTPRYLLARGRDVFLSGMDPAGGQELVRVSAGGAIQAIDVRPGSTGSSPQELALHQGVVYFSANVPAQGGRHLWSYDPSTSNLLLAWGGSGVASDPTQITSAGELVFFSGVVPGGVRRLHVHDPRTNSTLELPPAARPEFLTAVGSKVFFRANVANDNELWVSDGTMPATFSPKNIHLTGSSAPNDLVEFDGQCYFSATNGTGSGLEGRELWKSDGSTGGTMLAAAINPGRNSGKPRALTVAGNTLFFVARPSASVGDELHALEKGSVLTTFINISSGSAFGNSPDLGAVGEGLVVAGAKANNTLGREPYLVTSSGFKLLANVATVGASTPSSIVATPTHVYFIADDQGIPPAGLSAAGNEVWGYPIAAAGMATCSAYGEGCPGINGVPYLQCNERPQLGSNTFAFAADNLAPNSTAILFAGTGRITVGPACSLFVLNPLITLVFPTSATGTLSVPLQIQDNDLLAGAAIKWQLLTYDPASPNGLFSATNALLTILGI